MYVCSHEDASETPQDEVLANIVSDPNPKPSQMILMKTNFESLPRIPPRGFPAHN
jgi:hypothetical protein